jgi:hypothetical protein
MGHTVTKALFGDDGRRRQEGGVNTTMSQKRVMTTAVFATSTYVTNITGITQSKVFTKIKNPSSLTTSNPFTTNF